MPQRRLTVIDLSNPQSMTQSINAISGMRDRIAKADRSVLREVQKVIRRKHISPMLTALHTQRGKERRYPADYPIEFESDRQRKFVMANLRGKPTKRSGALQRGWRARVTIRKMKIVMSLKNSERGARHVLGDVGLGVSKRQMRRYLKPIQRYHKKFWEPAQNIVNEHMDGVVDTARDVLMKWFMEEL